MGSEAPVAQIELNLGAVKSISIYPQHFSRRPGKPVGPHRSGPEAVGTPPQRAMSAGLGFSV